mmetsp:Transcript_20293/g.71765  ORF Transcript_20293/g.71765 Transcript_20293/m.71765 type:complete len:341 (-) Transcript_20293:137-1159(-)|eukprot:CAMPEP_0203821356 /NCGR_PEP_ID=MMETSP0115-20131106/42891_1 /ASSEMBLY_ACC=CAM_ASM_000227 /TAXON_ID=33651 /ORGANISM="Bicosoecid sp, Strain ms1" /LENGTH=340 /DNA_ID=CAMNT_0050730377 /DNA_START=85 /DNA_END=1107 /DNA_ORIENTATION=+
MSGERATYPAAAPRVTLATPVTALAPSATTRQAPVATSAVTVGAAAAATEATLGSKIGFLRPYVTGGLSAMFASACIQPIDLVKVRLQVGAGTLGTVGVFRSVVKEEGVSGLYRGLSAALTRQATYGTARIGLHTAFSKKLKEQQGGGDLPLWKSFGSAFTSGAIASAIGNPFDVALVRCQADGTLPVAERRGYTNVFNAVTRIVKEEGVGALYHGYKPTLLRAIAMNVGMMASYDQVHDRVVKLNGKGMVTDMLSSAAAGFFCAFLSLPPDMLKSRLQFAAPGTYRGLWDCATQVVRKEGVLTFWRGFDAYYMRCAPHAMIILMTRAQLLRLWDEHIGE